MFVAIVVAVAAVAVLVAIVVVAVGRGGELAEAHPDYPSSPLPFNRQVAGTDAALLRLPLGLCGYQRQITDEALERFAHALTERDTRIAVLEAELAETRQLLTSERTREQRAVRATSAESPWPVPGEQGAYDPWPEADPERFARSAQSEAAQSEAAHAEPMDVPHGVPEAEWAPAQPESHQEMPHEEEHHEEPPHGEETPDETPRETVTAHEEEHEQASRDAAHEQGDE